MGQTYGNLQFLATPIAVVGTTNLKVLNNLTVGSATVTGVAVALNVVGAAPSAGTFIGGNLEVKGSNSLSFTPASASSVIFDGTAAQTIGGAGTLTFSNSALFEINNVTGVTLTRPVTVNRGLTLTLGLITTTATNLLTLPAAATVAGGSSTSYVNGPVARTTATGASSNMVFPVGKSGNYRPLKLNISAQTNAVIYTGEQIESSAQAAGNVSTGLAHVSAKRYFTLSPSVTPSGFTGSVTLSFGANDYVTNPTISSFVVAKRDGSSGSTWTSMGTTNTSSTGAYVSPYASGTLTSRAFSTPASTFTSGSIFSLASTALSNGYPGLNPLPVELIHFMATATANRVNLSWATASEKDNDHFDLQRSATGKDFVTIGSVKGQGNSTTAHEYAFVDSRPLSGRSYYRLRQVDADGSSTYSPVATVQVAARVNATVYPNPSFGTVTLPALEGPIYSRLFNNVGQTLLSGQASGNEQLNLTKVANGTFFLELTSQAGRTTQRLICE